MPLIVFGNLEGTLLDGGKPAAYKKKLATAYLFRMPVAYGLILKKAGFNLLSIANNHITDFGQRGCISTTKTLDMDAIHYAGLEDHPFTIFKINGITYGFCAFAPCAHTVSIFNLAAAAVIIRNLKKQCDIVIVSFHGGAEGPLYEHIPFKMESHLNGKRGNVYIFAHNAINAGADVVFGSGPHVSRALELYQNHLIAYSLGNFCTYKSVSVTGVCGMAPLLKVYMNKEGKFLGGKIIAFRQTHEDGLVHDSLNHVINRINLVTKKDFPNSGLLISRDGKISAAESVKMN